MNRNTNPKIHPTHSDINVPKMLQPKGLFFVRPSMGQYLHSREELNEASKALFEKVSSGKIKVEIFNKYKETISYQ